MVKDSGIQLEKGGGIPHDIQSVGLSEDSTYLKRGRIRFGKVMSAVQQMERLIW